MMIDRRALLAAGGASLILPRFTLTAHAQSPMSADEKAAAIDALYQAAQEEGELTWYVAHVGSEVAELMGAKFTETYPGVEVNVVRTTAQVAFQRLNQDLQAGVNNCDVFASTVVAHFLDLKERDLLMAYEPARKLDALPQFQAIDPDNMFHTTSIGPVCIVYNTDAVSEADAPKNWDDLLDPKWTGQVAVGHPGYSGQVGNWVVVMRDLYGWEYFETLAERDPYIGRSIIDVTTTIVSGERQVGAGPMATTLRSQAAGNPVAVTYPTDGTVVVTAPSGIMKDAQHPNAAKLFIEFLLGPENTQIAIDEWNPPIIPGVEAKAGVADLGEIKTLSATNDQLINGIPEVSEMWRDLFGI